MLKELSGAATSQYSDVQMICNGYVYIYGSGSGSGRQDNQKLGVSIRQDVINISGNDWVNAENVQACKIGTIASAKIDEAYFDSDGCTMHKSGNARHYGTFNFITNELNATFTNSKGGLYDGKFTCSNTLH
jgi:hypothetical protein